MSSEALVGRFSIGDLIKAGAISAHKDGNFGSLYPRIDDFVDDGHPLLTAKVVNGGRIDFDAAQKLRKEKAARLPYGFIQAGDVLLSHNATIGRVAVVPEFKGQALIGTSLTYFRLDTSRLLPRYLACFFESRDFQNQLASVMGLSTRNQVPITAQRLLEVEVPSLTVQRKISDFVGALDDRVTLLRETNATLEAIAQALFKSWFVDFDPVHAKQQGRTPEGLDEATAELFPDSFEESELGLVPRGWRVRGIDQTCELGRGSSPRPIQKFMGGDVPWIKIADATASEGMFVFKTKEMIIKDGIKNSVKVQPGDLIMSNSASCGITVFVELHGCIHDGWLYFKNYQYISKNFLFFWLRKIADHLVHIADGSVQKNLNIGLVSSQKIICPSSDVLQVFEIIVGPLLNRVRENCIQAQTLATLRDTLLPRLISGQLRLPEAESMLADA